MNEQAVEPYEFRKWLHAEAAEGRIRKDAARVARDLWNQFIEERQRAKP